MLVVDIESVAPNFRPLARINDMYVLVVLGFVDDVRFVNVVRLSSRLRFVDAVVVSKSSSWSSSATKSAF